MAMSYSPNGGVGVRKVVIKLLMVYIPVFGPFYSQNCSSETGCVCWEAWDLSVTILWCIIAGHGLTC